MIRFKEPHFHVVRKARTKQRVTTTYGRLSRLSKQMAKSVQADLFHGIKTFRNKVSLDDVEYAYRTGSYGHILQFIPWEELSTTLHKSLGGLVS